MTTGTVESHGEVDISAMKPADPGNGAASIFLLGFFVHRMMLRDMDFGK